MTVRSKPQQAVPAETFVVISKEIDGEKATQRVHPRAFAKVWEDKGWALEQPEQPTEETDGEETPGGSPEGVAAVVPSPTPKRPKPAPTTGEEG